MANKNPSIRIKNAEDHCLHFVAHGVRALIQFGIDQNVYALTAAIF